MKVLLTHGYFIHDDPVESRIMKPYVPLGLLYISSWLKREGVENKIVDPTFDDLGCLEREISRYVPDVIGIYTTLMTKKNVVKIIRNIREHDEMKSMKVIVGGPDARYNGDKYLNTGADVVIPGEGEETFTETLRFFSGSTYSSLHTVEGIVFKDETGNIIVNPERDFLKMDHLPFPARHEVDIPKYINTWKSHHGYSSLAVNTMRGCPYSCNWCSKSIYGNTYRRRDPGLVAEELAFVNETYHPDQFWFTDDVFTISREWLKKFWSELEKRNLHVPYECISRTDCMDDEIISLLVSTGCKKLWIGAESCSQDVLNLMNRKINIRETIEIINKVKKAGIEIGTFIMLGYPGEKKKDIFKTSRYLIKAKPDEFTLTLAYPIKGTKFYEISDKYFFKPYEWDIQNEREIKFHRAYNDAFYKNAIRYIFNMAKMAKSKPGINYIKHFIKAAISRLQMVLNS